MQSVRIFAAALSASLLVAASGWALDYPCPTDPGFCYRDFGDDGCFDVGTDDGPINAEIEGQSSFPPVPPAGSIVCPPSVEVLTASTVGFNIELSTATGSSILIYAAEINVDFFHTMSGSDLLIGGPINGQSAAHLLSAGDIYFENAIKLQMSSPTNELILESQSGNVVVGPKSKIRGVSTRFRAPAGNVTLLEGAVIKARNTLNRAGEQVEILADGTVEMTRPKIKCRELFVEGAEVLIHENAIVRAQDNSAFEDDIEITATSGDVSIDSLTVVTKGSVLISGTNVSIGVVTGSVPRPKLMERGAQMMEILATGAIQIDDLALRSDGDVRIETTGTQIDVLNSDLVGDLPIMPTFEITASGAGSTCNLTGSAIKKANLVTTCDTVIGP